MTRAFLAIVFGLVVTIAAVGALQPATPRFEVASVRPGVPKTPQSIRVTDTRLAYVNVSLAAVILRAFHIEPYQLFGAPAWLNETGVDIQATFPMGSRDLIPEMLQALLADRFGLVTSKQPRPLEGYNLTVGKDGIKMREVPPADERKSAIEALGARRAPGLDGEEEIYRTTRSADGLTMRTVTAKTAFSTIRIRGEGFVIVDAERISMAEFVVVLRANLDKPVKDVTGLTGLYQFRIELAPSLFNLRFAPPRMPTSRSTFKAVESLGLKLEERRSPFDVLVIEKIEHTPTEN